MNRPIADVWRRVGACAIDTAIPVAVAGATWGVLTIVENVVGRPVGAGVTILWFVLIAIAWCVIVSAMQGGQGSPGMRAFGTRLIGSEDLRPLGFGRALLRNVVWAASCAVVVGFFSPLFDRSGGRQGWHDRVARAIMVQRGKRTPVMPQLPHSDRRASEWLAAMSITQGGDTGTITDVPVARINHYMTTTDHPRRRGGVIESVPGADGAPEDGAAHVVDNTEGAKRRIEADAARMQAERLQEERRRLQLQEDAKREARARADAADVEQDDVEDGELDVEAREREAAARDAAEIEAERRESYASEAGLRAEQEAAANEAIEQAGLPVPASKVSVPSAGEWAPRAAALARPRPDGRAWADELTDPAPMPAVRPAPPMPSRAGVESLVAMSGQPAGPRRGAPTQVAGAAVAPDAVAAERTGAAAPTSGSGAAVSADESTAVTNPPSSRIAQELSGVRAVATVVWDDGTQYRIYSRTVFGRNPDPGARGQIATIYDNSLSLSKTHFEISRTLDDRAEIVDLHSTNGVMLRREGHAALIQPGEPVLLHSGDVIEIGSRRARVEVIA